MYVGLYKQSCMYVYVYIPFALNILKLAVMNNTHTGLIFEHIIQ